MKKEREILKLEKVLRDNSLKKAEYIRVQAVLLRKKGYSRDKIVEITGKSLSSVEDWITLFNKKGVAGLKTKKRETAPNALLTRGQRDKIREIITSKKPEEVKLTGEFWNIPRLKELVKKEFRVEYQSSESYRRLLHCCGFSYQKAELVDKRRDEEEVGHFKKRLEARLKKGGFTMWW
ncbi:MAG: winged helix-turn-helix domain-containing protein [Candidatus Cloacimonetes bacterium]|nr:winged helix-turn-helix domain-containing protein [Candidatus Cloacimonadota bacterium]